MNLNDIKKKWCEFAAKMNKYGVPLPTVRDPKTGLGSISLTLVFISFNMVLVGLVGKWAGALGGIDLTQALNLFYACAALYWGRKFQRGDAALGDLEPSSQTSPQPPASPPAQQKVDDPDQQ
jgi:hypothetical protein